MRCEGRGVSLPCDEQRSSHAAAIGSAPGRTDRGSSTRGSTSEMRRHKTARTAAANELWIWTFGNAPSAGRLSGRVWWPCCWCCAVLLPWMRSACARAVFLARLFFEFLFRFIGWIGSVTVQQQCIQAALEIPQNPKSGGKKGEKGPRRGCRLFLSLVGSLSLSLLALQCRLGLGVDGAFGRRHTHTHQQPFVALARCHRSQPQPTVLHAGARVSASTF